MFALFLSAVPIDFQDGVNDFDVGINERIYIFFSFVCRMTSITECPKVLLNVD